MLCGGEKMEQKLRRDRNLGDNLRRLRNASGLSQEKLCAELQRRGCDIGRTTYAKYESGELNVRISVLDELKDIAARGGISCTCGSTRYTVQVRRGAVDLVCADCGGRLRLPAATDEDLDDLCCRMKLTIKGK